jgi:hypothetical protein
MIILAFEEAKVEAKEKSGALNQTYMEPDVEGV